MNFLRKVIMSGPYNNSENLLKIKPGMPGRQKYVLRLFVAGKMQNSIVAIKNIKHICEQHLNNNYDLEIIDIYQQPCLASNEQIIAIPVMIIKSPLPERRLLGDLSNINRVLEILNIPQKLL